MNPTQTVIRIAADDVPRETVVEMLKRICKTPDQRPMLTKRRDGSYYAAISDPDEKAAFRAALTRMSVRHEEVTNPGFHLTPAPKSQPRRSASRNSGPWTGNPILDGVLAARYLDLFTPRRGPFDEH